MSPGAAGFSDVGLEPVASTLYGLRFFAVDRPDQPILTRRLVTSGGQLLAEAEPTGDDRKPDARKLGLTGALRSVFKSEYQWRGGVNEAVCLSHMAAQPGHQICHPVCGCGFWAFGHQVASAEYGSSRWCQAIGVVEAWGRMVVGPQGFRAQYARIVALAFPSTPLVQSGPWWRRQLGLSTYQLARPPYRHENTPVWVQEAVAELYPEAALFGSVAAMLLAFPLTDTAAIAASAATPEPEAGSAA